MLAKNSPYTKIIIAKILKFDLKMAFADKLKIRMMKQKRMNGGTRYRNAVIGSIRLGQ